LVDWYTNRIYTSEKQKYRNAVQYTAGVQNKQTVDYYSVTVYFQLTFIIFDIYTLTL